MLIVPSLEPRSIYVHLPFCRRRCYYCDFPISVADARLEAKTSWYVDLVLRELRSLGRPREPLLSCYIGGGTPSLASAEEVGRIIDGVSDVLGVAEGAEVTLEADPGTFDAAKLAAYVKAGVTRVSLGAQSFQQAELEACGRSHGVTDTLEAIALLRKEPGLYHGWSLDLISGLPGQCIASWRETLEAAVAAEPNHVSVYDLQIQKDTAFAAWYGAQRGVLFAEEQTVPAAPNHRPQLPTEEETAELYVQTSTFLRAAGYDHYEISSYAKDRRSVHNSLYWQPGAAWFAVGLGATSSAARPGAPYPSAIRTRRPVALAEYEAYINGSILLDMDEDDDRLVVALADDVLISLRTSAGLPLARVRARAGRAALTAILRGAQTALDLGLAVRDTSRIPPTNKPCTCLRLTDPDGFLVSNTIIASIFTELFRALGEPGDA